MGLPVLQPVLQYGQTATNPRWQLQSWFVHGGAVTAPAIEASPGDFVTSYMVFDDVNQEWTIHCANEATGEDSTLKISKAKLGGYDFDWAMIVHETIMASSSYCAEYPASDRVDYSNVELDSELLIGQWTERARQTDCVQITLTMVSST